MIKIYILFVSIIFIAKILCQDECTSSDFSINNNQNTLFNINNTLCEFKRGLYCTSYPDPTIKFGSYFNLFSNNGRLSTRYDNLSLLTIRSNGYMGIGTSDPQYPLDVNVGDTNYAQKITGSTVSSGLLIESGTITEKLIDARDALSNPLFLVKADGNVGIRTSSPSTPLHLTTSDSSSGILIENSLKTLDIKGMTNNFYVTAGTGSNVIMNGGGSVGIGTTSPQQKLEVNGKVQVANIETVSPWYALTLPGGWSTSPVAKCRRFNGMIELRGILFFTMAAGWPSYSGYFLPPACRPLSIRYTETPCHASSPMRNRVCNIDYYPDGRIIIYTDFEVNQIRIEGISLFAG